MHSILQEPSLATPLPARSRMRPGVATMMCTVSARRMMSSRRLVPPVVAITSTAMCLPSSLHTWLVCRASSRVGTRIMAARQERRFSSPRAGGAACLGPERHRAHSPCTALTPVSTFSRTGTQKAAVLPVPFLARARMSRPVRAIGMLSSWMGEGRSKPFS